MTLSNVAKMEAVLMTIDRLGMATVKHLRGIHDLKSYRNACFFLKKLEPYTSSTFFNKSKVYYLNKEGRSLIGSNKEVKRNSNIEHTLLRNDVFLHLNCPIDWKTEAILEYETEQPNSFGIIVKGMNLKAKNKVVADAFYTRNGYTHIVEIDNTRDMKDNLKKIQSYKELFPHLDTPRLEVFTTTKIRKQKFDKWLQEYKLRGEVSVYDEVR